MGTGLLFAILVAWLYVAFPWVLTPFLYAVALAWIVSAGILRFALFLVQSLIMIGLRHRV